MISTPVTVVGAKGLPDQLWSEAYETVLAPSFPADELITEQTFLSYRGRADASVRFALRAGRPVGVTVLNGDPRTGLLLLSYLAVLASSRDAGIGGALMHELSDVGVPVLIEIEDPRVYRERGFGDPTRRLWFYHRRGVLALDVPYFQPPVAAGSPRVEGMILGVLGVMGDSFPAEPVRAFLQRSLIEAGDTTTDETAVRLMDAVRSNRVRLLPLVPTFLEEVA